MDKHHEHRIETDEVDSSGYCVCGTLITLAGYGDGIGDRIFVRAESQNSYAVTYCADGSLIVHTRMSNGVRARLTFTGADEFSTFLWAMRASGAPMVEVA